MKSFFEQDKSCQKLFSSNNDLNDDFSNIFMIIPYRNDIEVQANFE
jgi:hypothetical protein